MGLVVERRGTLTKSDQEDKPNLCHTCRERKKGLFTVDLQHKPICADCSRALGKPID